MAAVAKMATGNARYICKFLGSAIIEYEAICVNGRAQQYRAKFEMSYVPENEPARESFLQLLRQ